MVESLNPRRKNRFNLKTKTAALSTVMNILLTGIKFLVYFFSGSMVILAEAWHSLTDIITSLLVFITIRRSKKKHKEDDGENLGTSKESTRYFVGTMELLVSLGIGLLLMTVAVTLIINLIRIEPRPVKNSLSSGLLFLIFSLCSHFVYRFETRIGKREGSLGLASDGVHARADMTASLLTGFSLILYSIGLNLDRLAAGLIAFFILSFSLEIIINVAVVYFRHDPELLFRFRTYKIIGFLFDKGAIQKAQDKIGSALEKKFGHTKLLRISCKSILYLPFVLFIVCYVSTTIFVVGINEEAVIERFGRPLNVTESVGPGLHLKLPWPFDQVREIETASIEELYIGNIADDQAGALIWTKKPGTEEPFLSGDNNFFYPYIVLHYRVKDIFQFLYRNTNTKMLVNEVAHRVATVLFAQEAFYNIAAMHRGRVGLKMEKRLQQDLDKMKSGVELLSVNFKYVHPPTSIVYSFEEVTAAYQDKQRIINNALEYQNKILPESRGKAAQIVETAKSYITDRQEKAQGDATRFILSLPTSSREKQLTMSRIYLQTIPEILREKTKILIDPKSGEPDVWIDFEKITHR
ncbi:MAG: hypothetical protein B1H12_03755 [Desulfobacteraceae bacterium 4484_190.2]|nr:MAG: hypothetical protein B1H12_03755 [Desulfobacteraceae bacterium 4484_190.2]